jgi:hypothetical protein
MMGMLCRLVTHLRGAVYRRQNSIESQEQKDSVRYWSIAGGTANIGLACKPLQGTDR